MSNVDNVINVGMNENNGEIMENNNEMKWWWNNENKNK